MIVDIAPHLPLLGMPIFGTGDSNARTNSHPPLFSVVSRWAIFYLFQIATATTDSGRNRKKTERKISSFPCRNVVRDILIFPIFPPFSVQKKCPKICRGERHLLQESVPSCSRRNKPLSSPLSQESFEKSPKQQTNFFLPLRYKSTPLCQHTPKCSSSNLSKSSTLSPETRAILSSSSLFPLMVLFSSFLW